MNRITALFATVALAAGLSIVAAPAYADEPVCDAACVTAYEDKIAGLESDVDWLTFKLMVADAQVGAVESKLAATQTSLDLAYAANHRLTDRFEFQRNLALTRRATIINLRAELRDAA
jgi:hypothetical protein